MGFAVFGGADVIAQANSSTESLKLERIVVMGACGIFLNGFAIRKWFHTLDKVFGPNRSNIGGVLKKNVADQICYAPFAATVCLVASPIHLGGTPGNWLERATTNVKEQLVQVWLSDCAFWPAANFVAFRFVPTV